MAYPARQVDILTLEAQWPTLTSWLADVLTRKARRRGVWQASLRAYRIRPTRREAATGHLSAVRLTPAGVTP
jgi:hypothetical protein